MIKTCCASESPIRLVGCDLDGTLLGPGDDEWIKTARSAVRYCRARGVRFTIATGRVYGAVERYLPYLEIDSPVITNGGALVIAPGQAPLLERTIDRGIASLIAVSLRRKHLPFYFIAGRRMFTEWTGEETRKYSETLSFEIETVKDVTGLPVAPTQIAVRVSPKGAEALASQFQASWPNVNVILSLPHLIEFQAHGVSKGEALGYLAQTLGIRREETLAIGDSLNDLDMLAWAGRSACVGNAHPEVMKRVDAVARGSYSEGVLELVKKFI